MDLAKVLQELHEELENLNAAILSLERLEESGRRRGRPPAVLAELKTAVRARVRKRSDPKLPEAAGQK
jgi:hypothetical protein